jgi:hypothetical protein
VKAKSKASLGFSQKIEIVLPNRDNITSSPMDFTYFCQTLLNNDYEPCPTIHKWAAKKNDVFVELRSEMIAVSVQGYFDYQFPIHIEFSIAKFNGRSEVRYPLLWFLDRLADILISTFENEFLAGLNGLSNGIRVEWPSANDVKKYFERYANNYSVQSHFSSARTHEKTMVTFSILKNREVKVIEVVHTHEALLDVIESSHDGHLRSAGSTIDRYRLIAKMICYFNWAKDEIYAQWMEKPAAVEMYGIPETLVSGSSAEPPTKEIPRSPKVYDEPPTKEIPCSPKVYDAQAARERSAEVALAQILGAIKNNSEKGLFHLTLVSMHQEIEKHLIKLGFGIDRSNPDGCTVTW